ncbi:MAG: potassium-transporting ATPase subunit KdpA, partial [Desulfobacteraceae bacterium]|nr:potassium-transporting ATPase subunit KdpA [Desulfobacteraceae bacterium]
MNIASSLDLLQFLALLAAVLLLAVPLGGYMARVASGERTLLSPVLAPCEELLYRICGVDQNDDMSWQRYALALLLFNLVLFLILFAMLLGQRS